ncbi:MAG: class I SAM-dependent methyltransferase [Bacteroidetes bacterium]|nr:class I SAM-dependent methyltransferase [Bacteroidota bacterium]
MTTLPIYNKIGTGYNTTRRADPYIVSRMLANLNPNNQGKYIDIGSGTGNYTNAYAQQGFHFIGAEPSDRMIGEARSKYPGIEFIQTKAEDLQLEDESFDGATGTFTLHHWDSMEQGLMQVCRVLKRGTKAVFLSFTPEQIFGYWLCHYFPETMRNSAAVAPSIEDMTAIFLKAGFKSISTEKYFVHDELQDHFLYSNKNRPEQYLRPEVRNGASSFTLYANQEEVAAGLIQLEKDIANGEVWDIIKQYENDLGDYLFYVAQK